MSQTLSKFLLRRLTFLPALLLLVSCGGGDTSLTAKLTGQVSSVASNSGNKATHYAASRFLEQATMGPSPAAVAQVKAQGIEGWIRAQLMLPPTLIVTAPSLYEYELNVD